MKLDKIQRSPEELSRKLKIAVEIPYKRLCRLGQNMTRAKSAVNDVLKWNGWEKKPHIVTEKVGLIEYQRGLKKLEKEHFNEVVRDKEMLMEVCFVA